MISETSTCPVDDCEYPIVKMGSALCQGAETVTFICGSPIRHETWLCEIDENAPCRN